MAEIIPFVARIRDAGSWTAAERAKLDELASQFARTGVKVEIVYGVSEEGDPWCVVKDDNEDVLLHVARIDSRFVVHQAADDSLTETSDLPAALRARLADLNDNPQDDTPTAVAEGRRFQILAALLAATAFFNDTSDSLTLSATDDRADPTQEQGQAHSDAPSPLLDAGDRNDHELGAYWTAVPDATATPNRTVAAGHQPPAPATESAQTIEIQAKAAAAQVAAQTPHETQSAPAPPSDERSPHTITGSDKNDVLVGTDGADLIRGGGGDDTLSGGGAPANQRDTLDGGAGDDRIVVSHNVIAIGGPGADTFVIQNPDALGDPTTSLGVITDYHPQEGDRLVNIHGAPVTIVSPPPGFAPHVQLTSDSTPAALASGVVFVDLNGDGVADGYLTLGPTFDGSISWPTPWVLAVGQSLFLDG